MASTYSTNLKLELIGNGDQSGTWGTTTNKNLGTLLEQAIAGIQQISIPTGGNYVLTNLNGVSDEARNAVLVVPSSVSLNATPSATNPAANTILVPSGQTKIYIVVNNSTGGQTVNVQTYGSGSGSTALGNSGQIAQVPSGASILIYCTGTDCSAVAPYTSYTAVPVVATGYISGTTMTISSLTTGTLSPGQSVYNSGVFYVPSAISSGTTIVSQTSGTTGGAGVYVLSKSATVGTVDYPQPIIALTTPNQIATVDYVQNKLQSPYFQGQPTADTATAAAFEGAIVSTGTFTGVLIASKYYIPNNQLLLGQYLNSSNTAYGAYISGWGTLTGSDSTGNATFTGYIDNGSGSAGTQLTVTSVLSGTITTSQYLEAPALTSFSMPKIASKISGTGGTGTYSISGSAQLIGSATSPVTFNAYGPLTSSANAATAASSNIGGWVNVSINSIDGTMSAAQRNPVISYLSPLQISNTLFSSNFVYLIGTLGSQNDNNVNIQGGTINNVTLTNLLNTIGVTSGGTGVASLIPNAALIGNTTSTGAVSSVRPNTLGNVLTSTAGTTVTAGSFVVGVQYSILTVGTTDFTLIGASANTVGVVFNATGVGSGTGTAQVTTWTSSPIPNVGIGVNQTYQNVFASRALGTTYTNSTGKPIFVMVSVLSGSTSQNMQIIINSVNLGFYSSVSGAASVLPVFFIVPNGQTYAVIIGSGTLQSWAELR